MGGADVKRLGPVVGDIKILAHAGEAGGGAQRVPAGGLVSRAAKELGVHETFHGEEGMSIGGLPVVGEARTTAGQGARGQIGELAGSGEQQEAGVVGQQMQAATALLVRPAQPGVAALEMIGGGTPAQEGEPLVVGVSDDIAQPLADERGVLKIVARADQVIPAKLLLRRDQSHPNLIQRGLFCRIEPNRASCHAGK